MTPKELADDHIDIIFEDDKVLFIKVYNRDAAEYYGSVYINNNYSYFRGETRSHGRHRNDIYFIVNKDDYNSDENIFIVVYQNSKYDIMDFDGKILDFSDVLTKYPQIKLEFVELVASDTPYGILTLIKSGKKVDKYDLNKADECLSNLKFNEKNPGKSMIELSFEIEEYFKLFDFQEGDWDRNILGDIFTRSNTYYGGYSTDLYNSDSVYEDWKEGYILESIGHENLELLDSIISFISPNLISLKEKDSENYYKQASKLLSDNFSREADDIQDEYQRLRNEDAKEHIKQEAIKDIGDVFHDSGIFRRELFRSYFTTVTVLLKLYNQVTDKSISITELLKEIADNVSGRIGYYAEAAYNTYLDVPVFHSIVKNNLEEILEKIESNPDEYESARNYGNLLIRLSKLGYKIGSTYKLPNNPNKEFRIEGVDKSTSRIHVREWGEKSMVSKMKSFTIEEFADYLNSPELFENLIRKLKKLL